MSPRPGFSYCPLKKKTFVFTDRSIQVISWQWPAPRAWINVFSRGRGFLAYPSPRIDLRLADDPAARRLLGAASNDGAAGTATRAASAGSVSGSGTGGRSAPRDPVARKRVSRFQLVLARAMRDNVPPEVRAALKHYPPDRQWIALSCVARTMPHSLELAVSAPALCLAAINHWVFNPGRRKGAAYRRKVAVFRSLLRLPRKEIARHLGFPGQEAVNILAKIRAVALNRQSLLTLLCLRAAMKEPSVLKWMRHIPHQLGHGALRLASHPGLLRLVTFRFFCELAQRPDEQSRARCAYELLQLAAMAQDLGGWRGFPLRSVAELRAAHEALRHESSLALWRQRGTNVSYAVPHGEVSFIDNAGVEVVVRPIVDRTALIQAGRSYEVCVGSMFYERVLLSGAALYKVERDGERALLEVRPTPDGHGWRMTELRGFQNSEVSVRLRLACHRFCDEWLNRTAVLELDPSLFDVGEEDGEEDPDKHADDGSRPDYEDEVPF